MDFRIKAATAVLCGLFAASANAQNTDSQQQERLDNLDRIDGRTFTGKISPFVGVGSANSDVNCTIHSGALGSVGIRLKQHYIGAGAGFEYVNEHYTSNDKEIDKNVFCCSVPIFAHYTYAGYKRGYEFDAKVGPAVYVGKDKTTVNLYALVTPLGYAFDNHNSIGLGYRFMLCPSESVVAHGVQLTYTYTF